MYTSSPYSVVVNNLGAGDYTFSAVATDNGGLRATNAIVVHVVTPVPIVLSALQRPSPTSFQFNYSANVGLRYVVQRSGALPSFTPISTNTAASNPVTFLDNGADGGRELLPRPPGAQPVSHCPQRRRRQGNEVLIQPEMVVAQRDLSLVTPAATPIGDPRARSEASRT